MFVSMWMTKNPICVSADLGLEQIQQIFTEKNLRRLPVVDENHRLLGLIESTNPLLNTITNLPKLHIGDVELSVDESSLSLTAADIMTPLERVHTTEPEVPIEFIARTMSDSKIGVLLVLRDERLLGIITDTDVFRALTAIFNSLSSGVRITFDNSSGRDVFPLIAEVAYEHRLRVVSFVSLHEHERPLCVVQVTGHARGIEAMLNDIWKSHHQVISVLRLGDDDPEEAEEESARQLGYGEYQE